MWKIGGIKIECAAGRQFFFTKMKWKFVKTDFFLNRSVTENFQQEIFRGKYLRNSYALRIQSIYRYERGVEIFLTEFCLPKVWRCR